MNKPQILVVAIFLSALIPPLALAADASSDFTRAVGLMGQSQTDPALKAEAKTLFEAAFRDYESRAEGDYRFWYEAGNARWWSGDAARAILDYRKYLVHDPFRVEVWENLAVARKSAGTMDPGVEGPGGWPWALWLLDALSLLGGLTVLVGGIWLWNRKPVWLRAVIFVFSFAVLAGLGLGLVQVLPERLAVSIIPVQGHKGDAEVYIAQPLEPWRAGQEFRVQELRNAWARVTVGATLSWVPVSAIEELRK